MQISNRSARSAALPKVSGGEDRAQGGGGEQLLQDQVGADEALPDQVGADESLPDTTLEYISQQVGQEQLEKSTGKLPPLLKQGKIQIQRQIFWNKYYNSWRKA